ncbi:nucleotidyltransferase [Virgisporangium aliadipatigenens]|uniref:Nucleotidyltransferase n=1 Tax=Virgisporangium aliadipatigenens TaxID=741659 RepID=A0A8J4DNV5_9ACTN|nr:nucleotidyltransferase domain-containing protein [Virgisporangium aliadipatigenens]GIJ43978.1 nucleotidyltransferase [Virgisporangium aliadipatigenens]
MDFGKDPLTAARELVAARFPSANWAMLTGSVLGPHRTAGSDLDIVVLHEDGPGYRESLRFRGWPVELFVHTPERLTDILARELAARKPSTHRMLATGTTLHGDPGDLPARCARVLAEGPPPLTDAERDRLRYALTDLLDDLTHATDAGERAVIATTLWSETAQAALAFADRWAGKGKWLLRELRVHDPALAAEWLAAREDPTPVTTKILEGAGGPLFEGYRVD